jgi:periplasmic divalent cation tolerance protein
MSEIVSVYATFGSDEEARKIGRRMVDERMAACVNILGPCHSFYRWENRIHEGDEVAAVFKTTAGQAPLLIERIAALHSYDVPAAVVWPIDEAPQSYRQWIIENSGR